MASPAGAFARVRMLGRHRREEPVEARLAGHLRMEGGGEDVPLADRDDPAVLELGQDVDVGTRSLDDRRSDEDRVDGLVAEERHRHVGLERVELASEGVAADGDVEQRQDRIVAIGDLAREDDHPGTGPEHRGAGPGELEDRLLEAPAVDQAAHRRRLATGQDQSIETLEIGRQPNLDGLHADRAERRNVLRKVTLDCEDADPRGRPPRRALARRAHQPRTASRSPSGICSIAIPRIGAPRPFETSARILGSSKWVVAWTIALAMRAGSSLLKIPEPTNTPSAPSCITSAASAGVEMPPATKLTTGSLPSAATCFTSSYGAWSSLAATNSSSSRMPWSRRSSDSTARSCITAETTLPVPASPFVRIIAAPSLIRRRASPRFRQPHTKGTLKACLSMWFASSAGVRTSDSSM